MVLRVALDSHRRRARHEPQELRRPLNDIKRDAKKALTAASHGTTMRPHRRHHELPAAARAPRSKSPTSTLATSSPALRTPLPPSAPTPSTARANRLSSRSATSSTIRLGIDVRAAPSAPPAPSSRAPAPAPAAAQHGRRYCGLDVGATPVPPPVSATGTGQTMVDVAHRLAGSVGPGIDPALTTPAPAAPSTSSVPNCVPRHARDEEGERDRKIRVTSGPTRVSPGGFLRKPAENRPQKMPDRAHPQNPLAASRMPGVHPRRSCPPWTHA